MSLDDNKAAVVFYSSPFNRSKPLEDINYKKINGSNKRNTKTSYPNLKSPIKPGLTKLHNSLITDSNYIQMLDKRNPDHSRLPKINSLIHNDDNRTSKLYASLSVRESRFKNKEISSLNRNVEGVSIISPPLAKGFESFIKDNYYENLYEKFKKLNNKKMNNSQITTLRKLPPTNHNKRREATYSVEIAAETNQAKSYETSLTKKELFNNSRSNEKELKNEVDSKSHLEGLVSLNKISYKLKSKNKASKITDNNNKGYRFSMTEKDKTNIDRIVNSKLISAVPKTRNSVAPGLFRKIQTINIAQEAEVANYEILKSPKTGGEAIIIKSRSLCSITNKDGITINNDLVLNQGYKKQITQKSPKKKKFICCF